ncbi:MAG: hypothetical protein WCA20_18950, partial [Candidatus Sulfotelmatobacter sp.]
MPLEPVLDVLPARWASDLCQLACYDLRDEWQIAITGQSVPALKVCSQRPNSWTLLPPDRTRYVLTAMTHAEPQ